MSDKIELPTLDKNAMHADLLNKQAAVNAQIMARTVGTAVKSLAVLMDTDIESAKAIFVKSVISLGLTNYSNFDQMVSEMKQALRDGGMAIL